MEIIRVSEIIASASTGVNQLVPRQTSGKDRATEVMNPFGLRDRHNAGINRCLDAIQERIDSYDGERFDFSNIDFRPLAGVKVGINDEQLNLGVLLTIMTQGIAQYPLQGANFSGADLTGVNLSFANLSRANFSHAILRGTNFIGTNLTGVNFSGADLFEALLYTAYVVSGRELLTESSLKTCLGISTGQLGSSGIKNLDKAAF